MNKITKKITSITLLLMMIVMLVPTSAFASEFEYKEIINPQYEDAGSFNDGLAPVKKDGKWGYIDKNNNVVIPFIYDVAFNFSEGKAIVSTCETKSVEYTDEPIITATYGFVDVKGNYTQFMKDASIYDAQGNTTAKKYEAFVQEEMSSEYYYNPTVPLRFYNGYAILFSSDDMGNILFDTTGKQSSKYKGCPSYYPTENIMSYNHGAVMFYRGYTDEKGNALFTKYNFADIRPFNQGLAPVLLYDDDYNTNGWCFIDTNGKIAINQNFDDFYVRNVYTEYKVFNDNNLASIEVNGKWGAIDKTGATKIPFIYDKLTVFCEGVAAYKENGKYGYIDVYGNTVIPAQFDDCSSFNEGIAVVRVGDTAYCIDKTGNKIEGADKLPVDSYFIASGTNDDGTQNYTVYSPEETVVIKDNGKYGFGTITYKPDLPSTSEMDTWAYDEVVKAIENNLVPNNLQNMYRTDTTRVDFAALVVRAIEEVTSKDIEDVVKEKTGKSLYELINKYPFSDTTNYDVIAANALGIINGVGNNKFAPDNNIKRQDAAALLMRTAQFLGQSGTNSSVKFSDDAKIKPYAQDAVNYVSSLKIMNGTGNNNFSPDGTYTRQQAYLTIYRLFENIMNNK